MHVLQYLAWGQFQIRVFETVRLQTSRQLPVGVNRAPRVNPKYRALALRLPRKAICYRFDGIGLVGLFFKFEFHSLFFEYQASFTKKFIENIYKSTSYKLFNSYLFCIYKFLSFIFSTIYIILWSVQTPLFDLWSLKIEIDSAKMFVANAGSTNISKHITAFGQVD